MPLKRFGKTILDPDEICLVADDGSGQGRLQVIFRGGATVILEPDESAALTAYLETLPALAPAWVAPGHR